MYVCMYVFVRIYGEKEFMKAKMHRVQESYDVALVVGKTPKTILKKKCSKMTFL